ncbi:MAG: MATE family efflux transporter [Lachnospiraceae bacterium]|nr:MATE family efflux transporter [Lachnospiraceae bacterium]
MIEENEIQKKTAARDLGSGSVGRLLLSLAIPTVTAQLVNMLYNIVDRMYIGHIPEYGVQALTGLGLCFPILMLVTAFSALVGMGGAPQAAIAMGQKKNEKAEQILGNCFSALLVISATLTVFFLLFGPKLLVLFGASKETLPYAWSYMQIYVCGTVFVQLAIGMNAFITTQGFTKISMMTVLIGAVTNIILDPILIFGLHMGVRGAAVATVLSQSISSLWVLRFLTGKKTILRIRRRNMKIQGSVLIPVIGLGISPFVMQSTESLLNICFNSSLARYGGDIAVGSMTILSSVMQIMTLTLSGISQAAQPIISFNYGAKKDERVKEAVKLLCICLVTVSTVFFLAVELFPGVFVAIFNNSSAELAETTSWAMRIYFGAIFMMGFQNTFQQSFVALGQARISLFLACLRKLILLIPLIYIFPMFLENKLFAVFLAEPVSDFIAAATTTTLFLHQFPKILERNNTGK